MATTMMTFKLNEKAREFLEERKTLDENYTATIHRALSVYQYILEVEAKGEKLCVENSDGQIERLKFL